MMVQKVAYSFLSTKGLELIQKSDVLLLDEIVLDS